jgi:hypothetical protein
MQNDGKLPEEKNETKSTTTETTHLQKVGGFDPRPKSSIKAVPQKYQAPQKKKPIRPGPRKAPPKPPVRTKKLTVLIETKLLTKFKIEALNDEISYSALATKAIHDYLDLGGDEEQTSRKLLRRHTPDQSSSKIDEE